MSSVVWKFPVTVMPGVEELEVPHAAVPVSAEQQGENIAVWYIVPDENLTPLETRRIITVMTGQPFDVPTDGFIATVQCHGFAVDPFVLHVFEEVVK